MAEEDPDLSYQAAFERLGTLLELYAAALVCDDASSARRHYDDAYAAWERLRRLRPQLQADGFLTFAFSSAAGAKAEAEAKRIYEAMSEAQQNTIEFAEAAHPGSVKIWLK
jgi:hypothetical protein